MLGRYVVANQTVLGHRHRTFPMQLALIFDWILDCFTHGINHQNKFLVYNFLTTIYTLLLMSNVCTVYYFLKTLPFNK